MGRCWTTSTPSKCQTLSHCWLDAGPTSKTTCLHRFSIVIGLAGRSLLSKRQTLGPVPLWCWSGVAEGGPTLTGIGSMSRVWWLTVIFILLYNDSRSTFGQSRQAQGIGMAFVRRRPNVFDAGPKLYRCWLVLCVCRDAGSYSTRSVTCIYRHILWQRYPVTRFLLV